MKSHFNCITDSFSLLPASYVLFAAFDLLSCHSPGVLELEIEFHTLLMNCLFTAHGTG